MNLNEKSQSMIQISCLEMSQNEMQSYNLSNSKHAFMAELQQAARVNMANIFFKASHHQQ
jgi:hypothetical protein